MNDGNARRLSWGAALLCAFYIAWECFQFRRQVPVLAQLFLGIGVESLPGSTRFILWLDRYIWQVGSLLILLVVGKELLIRDTVIRLAITFVIFLSAAWFSSFAVSAMLEPLTGILEKIR